MQNSLARKRVAQQSERLDSIHEYANLKQKNSPVISKNIYSIEKVKVTLFDIWNRI